eukprot:scaffold39144_cov19-Tisochrysis_lutea.AAC.1
MCCTGHDAFTQNYLRTFSRKGVLVLIPLTWNSCRALCSFCTACLQGGSWGGQQEGIAKKEVIICTWETTARKDEYACQDHFHKNSGFCALLNFKLHFCLPAGWTSEKAARQDEYDSQD